MTLTIELTDEQVEELRARAERAGRGLETFVQDLVLADWGTRRSKAFEAIRQMREAGPDASDISVRDLIAEGRRL